MTDERRLPLVTEATEAEKELIREQLREGNKLAREAARSRPVSDPHPCPLCGQGWWACGETLCPQPRKPRGNSQ
jgi:hypothetical protein